MRQWVLTLPHRLRYLLAWDHKLCCAVLGVFVRAVLGWQRRRAGKAGIVDGRSGAITVIQRFASVLRLNVHGHALVLDGVFYEEAPGVISFIELPPPTDEDVMGLVATVKKRVMRLLARRDVCGPYADGADDDGDEDPVETAEPALARLLGASVKGVVAMGRNTGAP